MADFPDIRAVRDTTKKRVWNTVRIDFGGYSQRAGRGLNSSKRIYPVKFLVNRTDAETIEDFLDDKGGHEAFNWIPTDGTVAIRVICEKPLTKAVYQPGQGVYTLMGEFEEVFDI